MKTQSKIFSILFIAGFMALSSCNSRTTNNNMEGQDSDTTTMQGDNTAMNDMDNQAGMVTDPEALTLVMTVDRNEIQAAEVAQGKQISQPVMDYANMLHTEHSNNLEKGQNLSQSSNIPTDETQMVGDLKAKGETTLEKIRPLSGNEFERIYIEEMIKGHQDAINMLDNQLIPSAQNEALRDHLTQSREHVAMHLERAKELQASMNK